jgi:hypothetical protein
MKDARNLANVWGLKNPKTNMAPVVFKDFVSAFSALKRVEGSLDSERIVYMVCHHFHHPREWLCDAVDEWCKKENIQIDIPLVEKVAAEGGRNRRQSPRSRGGFGVVARLAKAEIVKRMMRNMLGRAGWCIATKDNSKQGQGRKYEPVTIRIEQTSTQHTCFVVTKDASAKKPAAKKVAGELAAAGSNAENPVDVEAFQGIVSHVAHQLGQPALSHEKMKEFYTTYQTQRAGTSGVAGVDEESSSSSSGAPFIATATKVSTTPHAAMARIQTPHVWNCLSFSIRLLTFLCLSPINVTCFAQQTDGGITDSMLNSNGAQPDDSNRKRVATSSTAAPLNSTAVLPQNSTAAQLNSTVAQRVATTEPNSTAAQLNSTAAQRAATTGPNSTAAQSNTTAAQLNSNVAPSPSASNSTEDPSNRKQSAAAAKARKEDPSIRKQSAAAAKAGKEDPPIRKQSAAAAKARKEKGRSSTAAPADGRKKVGTTNRKASIHCLESLHTKISSLTHFSSTLLSPPCRAKGGGVLPAQRKMLLANTT